MLIAKKYLTIKQVLIEPEDAIINNEHEGFAMDYLCLHSLIRTHRPKSLFEIGTCKGTGTKIIKNAIGGSPVFSLELPIDQLDESLIVRDPQKEIVGDLVGKYCTLPYTQLRGNSLQFDYANYACDAYFVDGAHDKDHVLHETKEILKLNPSIVIYHDSDIPEVMKGIELGSITFEDKYDLFVVQKTRISFLVRKYLS